MYIPAKQFHPPMDLYPINSKLNILALSKKSNVMFMIT